MLVSLKKLNDRLKITVGSSFGLEGPQQKNQEASTTGDVSGIPNFKDGRYKIRAYRLNIRHSRPGKLKSIR
jgi:hypothetical protein